MPKKSDRAIILKDLDTAFRTMCINGDENSPIFDEMFDIFVQLSFSRYLYEREPIPKTDGLAKLMLAFADKEFKIIARMGKDSFFQIVKLIENHEVFQTVKSRHKQTPVWLQLLVTLNRLGCDGNGAGLHRVSVFCGVSYGSVDNYCKRVFQAIISLPQVYCLAISRRKKRYQQKICCKS
jgi:hypothetical protein